MIRLNIHEAKTHLSRYLAKLKKGEVIILCKRNQPVAEIRSIAQPVQKRRPIGLARDQFEVKQDFFLPLPEDMLREFSGHKP